MGISVDSITYRIGPPTHEKGPLVFLDYDQIELDAAYDQAMYAPHRDAILRRQRVASDRFRAHFGAPERFAYGPTSSEHLDVYRAPLDLAPVLIYVHGGAWKTSEAQRNAFIAETFVRAGVHCVLLDFVGIEDVDGSLATVETQVCRAICWVLANCARFGGNSDRVFLGAHSSGAHLAGAALAAVLPAAGVAPTAIKGALLCSGMYELAPVRLSKRSAYVRFDDRVVDDLSAIRHIKNISMPLVVAHGTEETPEFQRQSRAFYDALIAHGKEARLIVAEGYNHFDILETLGNPYGVLGRAALALIGAAS